MNLKFISHSHFDEIHKQIINAIIFWLKVKEVYSTGVLKSTLVHAIKNSYLKHKNTIANSKSMYTIHGSRDSWAGGIVSMLCTSHHATSHGFDLYFKRNENQEYFLPSLSLLSEYIPSYKTQNSKGFYLFLMGGLHFSNWKMVYKRNPPDTWTIIDSPNKIYDPTIHKILESPAFFSKISLKYEFISAKGMSKKFI